MIKIKTNAGDDLSTHIFLQKEKNVEFREKNNAISIYRISSIFYLFVVEANFRVVNKQPSTITMFSSFSIICTLTFLYCKYNQTKQTTKSYVLTIKPKMKDDKTRSVLFFFLN
jgi:hypothetical protein